MRNLRLRPGQRRYINPWHPQRQREEQMKNAELAKINKGTFDEQKQVEIESKNLSDKHKLHSEALADVDAANKILANNLRVKMQDDRYTGAAGNPDAFYRAQIDREWQALYPDTPPEDRAITPSSGVSLHQGET